VRTVVRRLEATMSTEPAQEAADTVGESGLPITAVGVDVGERVLVAAATPGMRAADAFVIEGDHVRDMFRRLADATKALQSTTFDTSTGEAQVHAAYFHRLRGQIIDAAVRTVEWAQSIPGAVLVLEDLTHGSRTLWEVRTDINASGSWAVPLLQAELVDRAQKVGIPVARVDPAGTSRECHRCGEEGVRERRTLRCSNPDCPVGEVDADASAAVSIATRF
jgi:IS605 OrfB family transposase